MFLRLFFFGCADGGRGLSLKLFLYIGWTRALYTAMQDIRSHGII